MSNRSVYHVDYTWIIPNYDRIREGGAKSPHFASAENSYRWCLAFRNSYIARTSGYSMKLFLEINNRSKLVHRGSIYGKYECSLINPEGQKVNEGFGYFRLHPEELYTKIEHLPPDSLYETGCILENPLTIYCKVSYIREAETDIFEIINQPDPFKEVIGQLLNNEKFSDVAVYIGRKKFKCHKNILATRSSVFEAMLSHNMKETNSNRIDIPDIDENVFKEVLRFIYTDQVDISETMTLELLYAADKYDLGGLKVMCEDKLCETLTVENVIKMLSISSTYNLENLKSQVLVFIRENLQNIMGTDAWNDLISQPNLMQIVLEEFGTVILRSTQKATY